MRRRARSRTIPIVTDWSDLRYFLEAARTGSYTAAARRLGVEHTTVARRLQRLARDYGTPLLERTRDGWEPTEAGRQLQYEAIHCGLGIGMLTRYLLQPESALIRVLPDEMWIERVLWLAAPVDMFARRRVRVVWDFLRGVVAAEPELFGPPSR